MTKKLWLNKGEFFPYLIIYLLWLGAGFMPSLMVKNQPGIVALGWVAVPSVILSTIAMVKSYLELHDAIGPGETVPQWQHGFKYEPKHLKNKGIIYGAGIIIFIIILFSTYLHYAQPQILKVPSNTDVASWENPAFKDTILYERSTDAERQKIFSEGVPGSGFSIALFNEIFVIITSLICLWHAIRHYGWWMSFCFFIGSFTFTGIQESMWILSGRFLKGSF